MPINRLGLESLLFRHENDVLALRLRSVERKKFNLSIESM